MPREYMSSDEVYQDLCDKIETLKYMPGEKISENELCAVYGVSRHIVRAAILRLRDRRLVEVFPQRGTFVTLIDMRYVETILYIREAIEHEAVCRLSGLKEEELDQLVLDMRANLVQQQEAIDQKVGMNAFYVIDNEFHHRFMAAIGQRDAVDLIAEHYIHVRRWRNFEIANTNRLEELLAEHKKVTDAIEARDFAGARKVLHVHLNTVARLQEIFRTVSPEYFIFRE